MFKNLENTIKSLNANVKDVANCEKAKKLRKKLLWIGLPLAIVGYLGALTCFVLFATLSFDSFLIPFFLFIPLGTLGGIGTVIASYGFKIAVVGYTTNLIDETVGNHCYNCKQKIEGDEQFCTKCGAQLNQICEKCNSANDIKSEFCKKCGNKLKK